MMRQVCNATGDKLFMNQEEFLDFMQKQCEAASNQDQIVEAFRVMSDDVDGTGKVKISELKNILTRVGQKFTEEEADMLIADAKQDTEDDMIDYKKFVSRMMARP
jgi:Ca2+-binding EF-hand superfamily protein